MKLSKKKKKKNYTVESFRPNGKHCLGRKEFLEQYGKSCFLLWNPQEMKKKISKKKACHIQKSKGKKCGWTIEKRERFSDLACPNAYLLLERNDLSLSLHFAELIKLLFCWASYNYCHLRLQKTQQVTPIQPLYAQMRKWRSERWGDSPKVT